LITFGALEYDPEFFKDGAPIDCSEKYQPGVKKSAKQVGAGHHVESQGISMDHRNFLKNESCWKQIVEISSKRT
jgi:hypothetical protein